MWKITRTKHVRTEESRLGRTNDSNDSEPNKQQNEKEREGGSRKSQDRVMTVLVSEAK